MKKGTVKSKFREYKLHALMYVFISLLLTGCPEIATTLTSLDGNYYPSGLVNQESGKKEYTLLQFIMSDDDQIVTLENKKITISENRFFVRDGYHITFSSESGLPEYFNLHKSKSGVIAEVQYIKDLSFNFLCEYEPHKLGLIFRSLKQDKKMAEKEGLIVLPCDASDYKDGKRNKPRKDWFKEEEEEVPMICAGSSAAMRRYAEKLLKTKNFSVYSEYVLLDPSVPHFTDPDKLIAYLNKHDPELAKDVEKAIIHEIEIYEWDTESVL